MNASRLKYLTILLFMISTNSLYGQDKCDCNIYVDSLFQSHFLSLDTTINCDTINRFVNPSDVKFVFLLGFLSGINYDLHSYTGQPQLNYKKVIEYKIWYNKYKRKLDCKTIEKGLKLLETEILTEEIIDELDKLKIE